MRNTKESRILLVVVFFLAIFVILNFQEILLFREFRQKDFDSDVFRLQNVSSHDDTNFHNYIGGDVSCCLERADVDEELSEFLSDETIQTPSTGESYTILLNTTNDVEADKVFLTYTFDSSPLTIVSMKLDDAGLWNRTLTVPLDAWKIRYRFHVKNITGNWTNTTLTPEISISDIIPPVAVPGANVTIDQGGKITLNASESYDNRGMVYYTWTSNVGEKLGEEVIFVFDNPGVYQIVLIAYDSAGNTHKNDLYVTVVDTVPPTADAGENQTAPQGSPIHFNASLSYDNVAIEDYRWSFKDGWQYQYLSGLNPNYTFVNPGNYFVTLKLTDSADNSAEDNVTITILDTTAPHSLGKATKHGVFIGTPVTFDGRNSWDNVGVTNWTWTIDSTELYGQEVSYTFDRAAEYTITLKVTDAAGNHDSHSIPYIVYGKQSESVVDNTSATGNDFPVWLIIVITTVIILCIGVVVILLIVNKRKKEKGAIQTLPSGEIAMVNTSVNHLGFGTSAVDTSDFQMNRETENIPSYDGGVFEKEEKEPIEVQGINEIYDNIYFENTNENEVPLNIRNVIPNYILTHLIGNGDFAAVYKGRDHTGLDVAIKLPKFLDRTLDASIYDRFESETKNWKNLKHKNIVSLSRNSLDPIPHIVMELMHGGNLKELMEYRWLGLKESMDIMLQILDGVSYAHRMASVHRHIKPENILFNSNGVAKVTDWGIGKFMLSEGLSDANEIEGSLHYSAPEQIDGKEFGGVDWSTDIFQMGIIFYEMLTGENPFFDDDAKAIIENIIHLDPRPPMTLNPDIPKELDSIILKALQKRKEDRWRSTDVMFDRVRRVSVKGFAESRLKP